MKTVKVSVRRRISSLPRRSAARRARAIMFGSIPPENNTVVKLVDAENFCARGVSCATRRSISSSYPRGLIKAPGTSLLAASRPEYLRASTFTLWAMIDSAVRIGAAESDDRFAGAAYSSQRQFGEVRFWRAVIESQATRHTVWNVWPHAPAHCTTSLTRCSVQIEQSEPSG